MALFSTGIQLVRLVITSVLAVQIPTDIIIALQFVTGIHETLNGL